MEENRPPVVAEKVCKTVRLIGFIIQNRGKNIGKALNNAMVRHHESLTCRPRDADMSYVSPLEYQFSCSGSPPRPSRALSRRKLSPVATEYGRRQPRMCRGTGERRRVKVTTTGLTATSMMLKESTEKEFQVDQAADEFIDRFYRELRLQKWLDHYC